MHPIILKGPCLTMHHAAPNWSNNQFCRIADSAYSCPLVCDDNFPDRVEGCDPIGIRGHCQPDPATGAARGGTNPGRGCAASMGHTFTLVNRETDAALEPKNARVLTEPLALKMRE